MKLARNIAGAAMVILFAVWLGAAWIVTSPIDISDTGLRVGRGGYFVSIENAALRNPSTHETISLMPGGAITIPGWHKIGSITLYVIPHWLLNVVAVSIFVVLFRKTRTPRAGCCQQCGYDLTGNVSGRCPECDTAITRPA